MPFAGVKVGGGFESSCERSWEHSEFLSLYHFWGLLGMELLLAILRARGWES